MATKINLTKYPVRTCKSMHHCQICEGTIKYGQKYYDGGYGRRAHDLCADAEELERAENENYRAAQIEYYKGEEEL